MDDLKRYEELVKTIEYHNDRYYNQDDPEISDYEYDMMMKELKKIEKDHPEFVTPNSPTQHVGGSAKREAGVLVRHRVPMLSLQDVFSKEEVQDFVKSMQETLVDPVFVVEYKIDGLSMALRYENGLLTTAITRGDGIIQGEDVTVNAKVIKDVKNKLKEPIEYLEVRGEVYMTNEAFDKVNEIQELNNKKTFANPRNCAAGTLRQLDSRITKQRNLSMFIFNIQDIRGKEITSHSQGYEYLKKQGMKVIDNYQVCHNFEEVWKAIQIGIDTVKECKQKGYDILATGEMGIGNTTTSSAVTAILLQKPVEKVTGKGAGLSSVGLQRKITTIETAINKYKPDSQNIIEVLACVGGLDIAGLTGVCLGGAMYHVPIVSDGFISTTAALCAVKMIPETRDYIIASHVSNEPAGRMLLEELKLSPFLDCNMCLGEGSGAVAAMPLLDMGLQVYRQMGTFADIKVEQYEVLE